MKDSFPKMLIHIPGATSGVKLAPLTAAKTFTSGLAAATLNSNWRVAIALAASRTSMVNMKFPVWVGLPDI